MWRMLQIARLFAHAFWSSNRQSGRWVFQVETGSTISLSCSALFQYFQSQPATDSGMRYLAPGCHCSFTVFVLIQRVFRFFIIDPYRDCDFLCRGSRNRSDFIIKEIPEMVSKLIPSHLSMGKEDKVHHNDYRLRWFGFEHILPSVIFATLVQLRISISG